MNRTLAQNLALLFGVVFLVVGIDANFIPMNGADEVLHLLLAITFIGAYFVTGRERPVVTVAP